MSWLLLIGFGVPILLLVGRFWGRLLRLGIVRVLNVVLEHQGRLRRAPATPMRREGQ